MIIVITKWVSHIALCIDQWDVMNAVTWQRRRRRNGFSLRVGFIHKEDIIVWRPGHLYERIIIFPLNKHISSPSLLWDIDQWAVMNAVTWHQPTNHSLMQNLWWMRRSRRRRNGFGLRVGLDLIHCFEPSAQFEFSFLWEHQTQ